MIVSSSGGNSVISGTPAYMSPEQLAGDPATPASDVFAFGLLLFELSTAERALPDAHVGAILKRLDNPRLAAELAAAMPAAWRRVAESMLARRPSRPARDGGRARANWKPRSCDRGGRSNSRLMRTA